MIERRSGQPTAATATGFGERLRRYSTLAGATVACASAASADVVVFDNIDQTVGFGEQLFIDVDGGSVQASTFAGADFELTRSRLRALLGENRAAAKLTYFNSCCTCSSVSTLQGALRLRSSTEIGANPG